MKLINISHIDTDQVEKALKFGGHWINTDHTIVLVKTYQTYSYTYSGTAWTWWGSSREITREIQGKSMRGYNHGVVLRVGQDIRFPKVTSNGYRLKRIDQMWPEGIPLEGEMDVLVYLAAHEFRHVKQYYTGKKRGEYIAEKHAFTKLNQWREATGREPVHPRPQKAPPWVTKKEVENE